MALFYLDSSALVKLLLEESESTSLQRFLADADAISSSLVLAEVPRAIRRAAARHPTLDSLLRRTEELLAMVALLPVDDSLLATAGAIAEPTLRALDAIHVASAIHLDPLDGFVSYDERQSAAARLVGLRTFAPGV